MPIDLTESGILIEVRFLYLQDAKSPMAVGDVPKSNSEREEQSENTEFSIVSTESGAGTETSFPQPPNASSPMAVNELPMCTSVRDEQK